MDDGGRDAGGQQTMREVVSGLLAGLILVVDFATLNWPTSIL